jgi:ATP-dependent protease ClpP protease subunit
MKNWYDIKNQADKVLIYFYGDICMDEWGKWTNDDTCPSDIVKAIKEANGKPLEIRINSGGGSVFGGMAIYNVLRGYTGKKDVYVDGIAASIASVIMFAGDTLNMPSNATIMAHKPWTFAMGDESDMEAAKQSLITCYKSILAVYGEHLADDQTIEDLDATIQQEKEVWRTGADAAKIFKINLQDPSQMAACAGVSLDHWNKTPDGIPRARAEPKQPEKPTEPTKQPEPQTDALDLNWVSAFIFAENEGSNEK